MPPSLLPVSFAVSLIVGCGSHAGLRIIDGGTDGSGETGATDGQMAPDSTPGETDLASDLVSPPRDVAADSTITGRCTRDTECLAVLDYRAGFECWSPVAASRADLDRDPCLVPWRPDPQCTTAPPSSTCVNPVGRIPVTHSCLLFAGCIVPTCANERCALTWTNKETCPPVDPLTGAPDCAELRDTFVNALASASACYPSGPSSPCRSDLTDSCGCPAPYDFTGPCASVVTAAFAAWRGADCPPDECFLGCPTPGANPVCAPDATAARGTCVFP